MPRTQHRVENEVLFHTGDYGEFWTFQGRGKKPFTNPMKECKSIELFPDDIVADVGAYVGEFMIIAALQGVKKVRSYEATPNTYELLRRNALKFPNAEAHHRAITGEKVKSIDLYLSKGIGVTNSIAKTGCKAGHVTVPALQYEEAVKDATVVKIDVEGAEYSYNIIQPQLRAIILEFHPLVGEPWQDMANEIMEEIQDAGFEPILKPHFKHGWDLNSSWIRR